MHFFTSIRDALKRAGFFLFRVVVIALLVVLAIPIILASWLFWTAVFIYCWISVIVSQRRTIFRYEDEHDHA